MPEEPSSHGPDTRGDHLGFVAHEVRNPLSTALWSAELLARMSAEERGGSRGDKLTAMCLRSLGRVRQLIEDHFLCERLDARGIPVRSEPVPIRALLDEIAGRRFLDVADPELVVPLDLAAYGDRVLLDRALEGLLAVAGREHAAVRVGARQEGEWVVIEVAGAPLGENPLDDPRKGSPGDAKGRALALPLARRIAAVLGGNLAVAGGGLVLSVPAAGARADAPGAAAQR